MPLVLHSALVIMTQDKTPIYGAGVPSLTILIDHGSHAVLPTIDRLQLEWLTVGVGPGGRVVLNPLKICRKGQSMF